MSLSQKELCDRCLADEKIALSIADDEDLLSKFTPRREELNNLLVGDKAAPEIIDNFNGQYLIAICEQWTSFKNIIQAQEAELLKKGIIDEQIQREIKNITPPVNQPAYSLW